jgi:hypothetical protein
MLDVWNHYNGRRGEFRSFDLPAEVASYGSITDYVPGNYLWRYAGPGSVEDLPCGGHNVSLTLETVPPIAASVVGADLFLRLRLSAGVAAGGEYAPGINETITLSVAGGDAFVALNGIAEAIQIGIVTGTAAGDMYVSGIGWPLFLTLNSGAGYNAGRPGIDEAIDLVLVGGAAEAQAPSGDPNFANVLLLLSFDGANDSTTFTDSSLSNLTPTSVAGSAKLSTAESKFGSSSGNFNSGSNANITYKDELLIAQSESFTWEWWAYVTAATTSTSFASSNYIVESQGTFDIAVSLKQGSSGGKFWAFAQDNSTGFDHQDQVVLDQWQHVALVRNSNTIHLYVDGVQSTTSASLNYALNNNAFFSIGPRQSGSSNKLYIDELRITKGVARYTANFTPPTEAFPTS